MRHFIFFMIFVFSQISYAGEIWIIKAQKKVDNITKAKDYSLQKKLDVGQSEEKICVMDNIMQTILGDMRKTCDSAQLTSENEINTVCDKVQKTTYKFIKINSNLYKGDFIAKVDNSIVKGNIELKNSHKQCSGSENDL